MIDSVVKPEVTAKLEKWNILRLSLLISFPRKLNFSQKKTYFSHFSKMHKLVHKYTNDKKYLYICIFVQKMFLIMS